MKPSKLIIPGVIASFILLILILFLVIRRRKVTVDRQSAIRAGHIEENMSIKFGTYWKAIIAGILLLYIVFFVSLYFFSRNTIVNLSDSQSKTFIMITAAFMGALIIALVIMSVIGHAKTTADRAVPYYNTRLAYKSNKGVNIAYTALAIIFIVLIIIQLYMLFIANRKR